MAPRSDREDRPGRRRRRRAKPVRLEQRVERALANAGLPEVGERVGTAVGQALSQASHEIDRVVSRGRSPRRPPNPPKEGAPPRRSDSDKFSLLWGLLEIRRGEAGEEHVSVLWGLLDLRTRAAFREEEVAGGGDPVRAALRRAERRVENLRSAFIFGSLGLGFSWIAWLSDASFWTGVWSVTAVSLLALAAGLVAAAWGERFRRQWIEEELDRTSGAISARRAAEQGHARAMQELTASIAHEIRNPITAAKSLVQQMGEDPASNENVEYARVALDELERVERSVSHLLRFARDEEVSLQEVRMAAVVDDALAALSERTSQAGVEIQRDVDSEGLMTGDPEKLRRVILNLVGNALDALQESGTPNPRIQLQTGDNLAGTEVWLRVRDNGPGIEDEALTRIWSPFHTAKKGGTGLGLAITRKIVEAHGGTIEVSGGPGKGAEFVLTFPKRLGAEDAG
ncbi:MAG: HAMP domain-containing sensor histidine kinase [Myxococcota bacterium]